MASQFLAVDAMTGPLFANKNNTSFSTGIVTPPLEAEDIVFESKFEDSVAQIQSITPLDTPTVAVIGVGYVGLHLVENFSRKYNIIAFDVSEERVKTLSTELAHLESVSVTSDATHLSNATHFLVSVPTLLLADKTVDTSYLQSAISLLWKHARPGATVVIESSVAVGMTRQLLTPLIQARGVKGGMSPERVDPGRISPPTQAIPKIISGLDDIAPGSLDSIKALYEPIFDTTVPVSSPEVAEMTKLYENCQRMVCIAYANEMADACSNMGINPFEVCAAAATKPFGYMPYTPSLGVGGHCIPVNPYYLLTNCQFPLLQNATERMAARPGRLADDALNNFIQTQKLTGGSTDAPRVLVVGAGFKRGQSVTSNSPGIAMMRHLQTKWSIEVQYADPLVEQRFVPGVTRFDMAQWNQETLTNQFDIIMVAMRQEGVDFSLLESLPSNKVCYFCE